MDEPGRLSPQLVDLLHCLGFIYLRHGQANRAAVLLMAAARGEPGRVPVLTTLAAALVDAGLGKQATGVIDEINRLRPDWADHPMLHVLRAHALLLENDLAGARSEFNELQASKPIGRE